MVNNFLPFANDPATANVETQADYLAAASGNGYVQNGFGAGIAISKQENKALRQATVGVAALTTFIADELGQDVLDSGGSAAVTALAAQIASAIKAAMQSGTGNYAADTGTANAMVATLSPAPTALTVGMTVRIKKVSTANTGATTLNLNALGVKPVVDEENTALVAGQIAASSILAYTYDGTSWRVSKPKATSVGAAGSTTQVQFNNGGVLGASANLVWDNTNGRVGVGTSAPVGKIHAYGDVWPSVLAENPSGNASFGLKGNSGQACLLHYGDSAGGNELRFGRWSADFGTWQANPVVFDMDAPNSSISMDGYGAVTFGAGVTAAGFYGVGAAPVGCYASWPTETPPTGWFECNGAAISRTTYASLFAVLGTRYGGGDGWSTFNIPDLRGAFPRAWDHGRGVDPDRASRTTRGDGTTGDNVGTWQWDQNVWHQHTGSTTWSGDHTHSVKEGHIQGNVGSDEQLTSGDDYTWAIGAYSTTGGGGNHQHSFTTDGTGGNESRPRNVNVMMIIRAY